jgi:hypothetical protein
MSPYFGGQGKTTKHKKFLLFGGFSLATESNEASENKLFSAAITSHQKCLIFDTYFSIARCCQK